MARKSNRRRRVAAKTYVLVHGAWHGGWCWGRVVTRLRLAGHRVIAPTCTGLGDRAHLLSREIGLDTFVQDIVAAIDMEDLVDVTLVGHSFGGAPISGAADRIPERIGHLVYLDATVLQPGQSPFSVTAPDVVATRRKAAAETSGGLTLPVPPADAFGITDAQDAEWLVRHLRPHPIKTYEDALQLRNPAGNGKPRTYIACMGPEYPVLAPVHQWVRKQPGWIYQEIKTGHGSMVLAPEPLTERLLAIG